MRDYNARKVKVHGKGGRSCGQRETIPHSASVARISRLSSQINDGSNYNIDGQPSKLTDLLILHVLYTKYLQLRTFIGYGVNLTQFSHIRVETARFPS